MFRFLIIKNKRSSLLSGLRDKATTRSRELIRFQTTHSLPLYQIKVRGLTSDLGTTLKSEEMSNKLIALKILETKELYLKKVKEIYDFGCCRKMTLEQLEGFNLKFNEEIYQFDETTLEQNYIIKEQTKENLADTAFIQLKELLEKTIEKPLSALFFEAFLNAIYYQSEKTWELGDTPDQFQLITTPLFMRLFQLVYLHKNDIAIIFATKERENLKQELEKNVKERSLLTKQMKLITKEIKTLEEEKKNKTQILKNERLLRQLEKNKKVLNKQIEHQRVVLKKDLKVSTSHKGAEALFKDYIHKFINCLESVGMTFEIVQRFEKKIRVLNFPQGTFRSWFFVLSDLKNKPMIEKPYPWLLNIKTEEVTSGGYALIHKLKLGHVLMTEDFLTQHKISWDLKTIETLNQLQSQAFELNGEHLITLIDAANPYYHQMLHKALYGDFYGESYSLNTSNKGLLKFIRQQVTKEITNFFSFLRLIKLLAWMFFEQKTQTVYFPIHVDRALRMYNRGDVNFMNSKLLRLLLTFNKSPTTTQTKSTWEWFVACQETKHKNPVNIHEHQTKEKEDKKIRSEIKLNFYKKIGSENNAVWFDATSSALQIYAVSFGLIDLAKLLNLTNATQYFDIIEEWSKELKPKVHWPKGSWMLAILQERALLKYEIMISSYGGTLYSSIKRVEEIANLAPPRTGTYAEKSEVVEVCQSLVREKLAPIFEFMEILQDYHKLLFTKQGAKESHILFKIEKNVLNLRYIKAKKMELQIERPREQKKRSRFKVEIEVPVKDKPDLQKMLRAIPPLLNHSLDAQIARKVRLELLEKHDTNVISIHDAFGFDVRFLREVQASYKEALFLYAFDQDPFTPFCLDREILEENLELKKRIQRLQAQIKKNKANPKWNNIRQEASPFIIYPE